mgnify:CR=1 FL=1
MKATPVDDAERSKVLSGGASALEGMAELGERISRTQTAIEYWLALDEALVREGYPDARLLVERMRIAMSRWPLPEDVPDRVRDLARRVEAYYQTGENPGQPVL